MESDWKRTQMWWADSGCLGGSQERGWKLGALWRGTGLSGLNIQKESVRPPLLQRWAAQTGQSQTQKECDVWSFHLSVRCQGVRNRQDEVWLRQKDRITGGVGVCWHLEQPMSHTLVPILGHHPRMLQLRTDVFLLLLPFCPRARPAGMPVPSLMSEDYHMVHKLPTEQFPSKQIMCPLPYPRCS